MALPLLLLVGVGLVGGAALAAASSSSSSAPATAKPALPTFKLPPMSLEQRFAAQAKRGADERAKREAESRAEIERQRKYWSKVPFIGPYFAAAYAFLSPALNYMIDFGNALSSWNAPDWNSATEKARVEAALQRFADVRLAPPNPMPDDEYKTYADLLERELAKLDALWSAKPGNLGFWQALVGWVEANPTYAPVIDMLQLSVPLTPKGTKPVPVWPMASDARSSDAEWVSPQALAMATLAAAMRGKDAAATREALRVWHRYAMSKTPELRTWDNSGWYLGGLLDAADRATR